MDNFRDAQILKELFGKLNYLSEWNILIEGDNIYRVSGTKIIKITLIDFIQAYSNVLYIAKSGTMVTVLNEDIDRLKINRLWMIINGEKIKIVSTNQKNKGLVILITPNNNIRRIHYINLYTADEYIKGAKKLRSGMSTKKVWDSIKRDTVDETLNNELGGKSGEAWGSKISHTILKLGNKLKLEPGVVVEINRLIISGPNIQIKEKLAREYEVEGEFLLRSTDGYNYNKQREECAKYGDILDKIVINAVGGKEGVYQD